MTSGILQEEARQIARRQDLPWGDFDGKMVVITGATGLIGKSLTLALLERAGMSAHPLQVVALVRRPERAREIFGDDSHLRLVRWTAEEPAVPNWLDSADYIFHCANMTDSSDFVKRPVETIRTTIGGGGSMLELAQRSGGRLVLFSTMETYGSVDVDHAIAEDEGGFLDAMSVRNSYPEAKRLDEALCAAYASEYGTQAMVLRLSQTFGPGVAHDDRRVFAEFGRCAVEGRDIVLLTDGSKRNSYLYTADAVTAALVVAAKGRPGQAYNAANDETFCSIREMADLVAGEFGSGGCNVVVKLDASAAKRFRKGGVLRLDASRLESLGWKAGMGLADMYRRLLAYWKEAGEQG